MFIDSHCHLDASEFKSDRPHVIRQANQAGVEVIVVPSVACSNFEAVAQLAANEPSVYYALGIHPLFIPQASESDLLRVEQALDFAVNDPKFVGVGEIGLDFFVPALCTDEMRAKQLHFYAEQLRMAAQRSLPVIVHVRRSVDLITKYIRRHPSLTGIAHAFNGSHQQASLLVKQGFKLGFGGAMTFSRAKQIRRLATELPLESLVLETDAPDIPPAWLGVDTDPIGVVRNEPKELPRIAQCMADLRGLSLEQVALQTSINVRQVFSRLSG